MTGPYTALANRGGKAVHAATPTAEAFNGEQLSQVKLPPLYSLRLDPPMGLLRTVVLIFLSCDGVWACGTVPPRLRFLSTWSFGRAG